MGSVERLSAAAAPEVVSVLCDAFSDYPVMRHVIGPVENHASRLRELIGFFVMARVLRDEVLLGISGDDGLEAAAVVSYPGDRESPPELERHRTRLWAGLGDDARARYEAFGQAASAFEVQPPHIHLNMIGVRRAVQGLGHGRRLLEAVHRLSAADELSTGVTLTTELDANVPFYERFGYERVGSADVQGAFTTHGFWRADP